MTVTETETEVQHNDLPDSATTARESVFHEVLLNSDGSYRKDKEVDFEIDPLEREQTFTSLAPTVPDEDEEEDGNGDGDDAEGFGGDGTLEKKISQAKEWWKFRLRPAEDDEPEDWWFASTAIPLLAATLGPMANVLSIAALVTSWRETYSEAAPGVDEDAVPYADPSWCYNLNVVSLAFGFLGNIFLLFNFTRAVRYIIALPATIILWFAATAILMDITISMHIHVPPEANQLYSQGYWHAVMAAILYFLCSFMLMINMLGYFLGHYPQNFELDDEQRNLILQTMMLFMWLAAGGGIFSRACGWSFADALYFSDVTILTVGFGDFFPPNDVGRGLIFPYAVGGIIILGLVVSSIAKFAQQLGHDKVVKKHLDKRRLKTVSKTVTSSIEAEQRRELEKTLKKNREGIRPSISAPFNPTKRTIAFDQPDTPDLRSIKSPGTFRSVYSQSLASPKHTLSWASSLSDKIIHPSRHTHHSATARRLHRVNTLRKLTSKSTKLKMLRDERDRFNEMRKIQFHTKKFKKYMGLSMSLIAFIIVWCVGALVFMEAEHNTYFQSLYFCYVSLLTIGYGDLAPKSNVGKPFFIVWSLCAIPTMTILISSMGDTIVAAYKQGTFSLADLTILPKRGYVRHIAGKYPGLIGWLSGWIEIRKEKNRLEKGFPVGPETTDNEDRGPETNPGPTLEDLASELAMDEHDLAHNLTAAIRTTADDLKHGNYRHYTYEEWVLFIRLIRFTRYRHLRKRSVAHQLDEEEEYEGIIEWDWIGEDSPMMADTSETEWVLDRLCESLDRYMRQQVPELKGKQKRGPRRSGEYSRVSATYNRRASERQPSFSAAADTGFQPVPITGVEGPRRRASSAVRGRNPSGVASPSSSSLHPTTVPGPGAKTPPIPGVSPHPVDPNLPERHMRSPSSDGAASDITTESEEGKSYEAEAEDRSVYYDRNGVRVKPLKPRPRDINTASELDVDERRGFPFAAPPIPASDGEDERSRRAQQRPSLASSGGGSSNSGSRHNSSSSASWWRRRQTLGGGVGSSSQSPAGGGAARRRAPSAGGGMQSLTAMRLKRQ